ncbi:hypothetical protein ACWF7H_20165 [Peribacillus butanolivorans]|uniref:hypothetical protein n=1 Tax=Peribacillus butanolivorans TaxID=421767 RepID=UPI0036B286E3
MLNRIRNMRLQEMNIQFDGASYKELLKEFQDFETDSSKFWRGVSSRLSVPYEWPIRIDHANGPIVNTIYMKRKKRMKIDIEIYAWHSRIGLCISY